jgi:hypothetical protein
VNSWKPEGYSELNLKTPLGIEKISKKLNYEEQSANKPTNEK